MILPKNLYEHESGRSRCRKKRSGKKSHRVFKNWTYEPDGSRGKPKAITHKLCRYNADLTSTYYNNPARGTQTVHGLGFDIDLSRTSAEWFDEKGRVSWPKIGSFLADNEAPLLKFITAVASSTSGKGLGLYLPISPLEIVSATSQAQVSARVLQAHIIKILNFHGIGADPGAMGLVRDIPNYFNPKKLIDSDLLGTDRLVDNNRYPVVAELLKYTNKHLAVRRLKSRDPKRLFSGHRTSEKKLAVLYEYLIDEALENSIWLSGTEIQELTNLSKSTLYKFLSSEHEWLEIINYGKSEGYELNFKPTAGHSERCYELLNNYDLDSDREGIVDNFNSLGAPELVQDGERNDYLTRAIIELKVKGVHYHDALGAMVSLAKRIPGASTSRNCRNVAGLVKSIYYHRIETFGTNLSPLSLILRTELESLCDGAFREFPKKSKKGTTEGSIQSGFSSDEDKREPTLAPENDRREEKNSIILHGDQGNIENLNQQDENRESLNSSKGGAVRPGDLPPKDLSARPEFGLLLVFAPRAAKAILNGDVRSIDEATLPESCEEVVTQFRSEFQVDEKKYFKTLKEKRASEFYEKDPLDRFENAYIRCLSRNSEKSVLEALVSKHNNITYAQARGNRLKFKGTFKRVLEAFAILPLGIRAGILETLLAQNEHRPPELPKLTQVDVFFKK